MKNRLIEQEKGSVAVYAIATVLCFIFILSGILYSSNAIRKNQLKTALKLKEVYAQDIGRVDEIANVYVQDGLVAHYDAINNTGNGHDNNATVWKDLSGNGNDITLYNFDGTATSGWGENVLNFDGVNDYCNRKNPLYSAAGLPENLTIEVVSAKNSNTVYGSVLSFDNIVNSRTVLCLWTAIESNRSYEVEYYYNPSNSRNDTKQFDGTVYPVNKFKTVSYGKSGTSYFTYLNGINKDTRTITDIPNWNSDELYLGRPNSNNYYFNGKIQSVRIYNRALTLEEINKNSEIDKEKYGIEKEYTFDYTGAVQEWTVPTTGKYKLEVFGAQGGSVSGYLGGKGGYSSGQIELKKGTKLYICIGGKGIGATSKGQNLEGGYNGGGSAIGSTSVNHICASGGGATHIATSNRGELLNYVENKEEVLIVAGGGGGARNQENHVEAARWGTGGSGGGLIGGGPISSYNSTSEFTELTELAGTQETGYAFGEGETSTTQSAGGGGWYGGYGGGGTPYAGCGAGGSGYIDGVNNGYSENGTNEGNGYAKITWIGF